MARTESAEDVVAGAALHLRMNLLGKTSYSASISEIDRGYARLLLDRIRLFGFDVVQSAPEKKG